VRHKQDFYASFVLVEVCDVEGCATLWWLQRDFDAVAAELGLRQENSETARRKLVDASRELKKTLSTVCVNKYSYYISRSVCFGTSIQPCTNQLAE